MENTETKKKAMIQALFNALGNVKIGCKVAGIDRSTHYEWMKTDPEYKLKVEDMAEVALDYVEGKLHELICGVYVMTEKGKIYRQPPNIKAIMFYLKTKGKKRGYTEVVEKEQRVEKQEVDDWSPPAETIQPTQKQKDEPVIDDIIIERSTENDATIAEYKVAEGKPSNSSRIHQDEEEHQTILAQPMLKDFELKS